MRIVNPKPAKLHISISTDATRVATTLDETTVELPPIIALRFTDMPWKALIFKIVTQVRQSTPLPLDVHFSFPDLLNESQRDELFICAKSAGARDVQLLDCDGALPIRPIITDLDVERLRCTIDLAVSEDPSLLEEELSHAEVVPQRRVPADVITMNSRVQISDEITREIRELTIVYPGDADARSSRVSVLSPLGAGLLGLREGASFEWMPPRKQLRRVRVESIVYQPELAGDWHL